MPLPGQCLAAVGGSSCLAYEKCLVGFLSGCSPCSDLVFCTDQLLSWHCCNKPSLLSCRRALVLPSSLRLCGFPPSSAVLVVGFEISSLISNYKVALARLGRVDNGQKSTETGFEGRNLIPPCRSKSSPPCTVLCPPYVLFVTMQGYTT